jgi:feruloyl esterase
LLRDDVGKLIQYAGWADSAIAPESGLNYYRKVTSVMGDVHDFYRVLWLRVWLIVMGPGPNSFGNENNDGPVDAKHDLLKAWEKWVERGGAPDKIIATKYRRSSDAWRPKAMTILEIAVFKTLIGEPLHES